MIPEHFYITSLGVMAYGFIYVPTILAVAVLLWRLLRVSWKVNAPITLLLLTLPFWDVYMIGRDADRLCNSEAGLHVYKTVEAEGFWGDPGIEQWSKYGFKYVESGGGDMMSRYTMMDGKVKHQRIQKLISRYASTSGDNHKAITDSIAKTTYQVIEIKSKEVLGELVAFSIYPGWWDKVVIGVTGTGSGLELEVCGNEPPPGSDVLRLGGSDVVRATLKPKRSKGDAR